MKRQRFEEGFPPSFPTNVNPNRYVETFYEFFRRWLPPESGKPLSEYSPEEFTKLCRGKPIELKTPIQFVGLLSDTGFLAKAKEDFFLRLDSRKEKTAARSLAT